MWGLVNLQLDGGLLLGDAKRRCYYKIRLVGLVELAGSDDFLMTKLVPRVELRSVVAVSWFWLASPWLWLALILICPIWNCLAMADRYWLEGKWWESSVSNTLTEPGLETVGCWMLFTEPGLDNVGCRLLTELCNLDSPFLCREDWKTICLETLLMILK